MSKTTLMRALALWKQITKSDPEGNSMSVASWVVRETFEALQEAIDLDPSETTAILLLGHFLNAYLDERKVTLLDLMDKRDEIEAQMHKPRELRDMLSQPDVIEAREAFISALRAALDKYEAAGREDVQKLLCEPDKIAILRRDALRSVAQLRVDQFLDGEPEPQGYKPVYNRMVHQWWNINSMLSVVTQMPSGISLNLIRHPDAFQSYFCFAVRNGGNLFVMTDVPEYAHPLQGYMSRRPERNWSNRASRNWFPYDLLNLEYDERSKQFYSKASAHRDLVAYQTEVLPLKPVAELAVEELVWLSMMFDLIVEKFWRRDFKAPELSYTAEMLKSSAVLIDVARAANLPVPQYAPVALPALTKRDIAADACTEEEIGRKVDEHNRWMEERYGPRVSDETLNLIAAPEKGFAVELATGALRTVEQKERDMRGFAKDSWLKRHRGIEKVDATTFGSRARLDADRKFIARLNFATQIDMLAKREFEETHEAVEKWYRERVAANAATLVEWCGNQELWVDDGVHSDFSHYAQGAGPNRASHVDDNDKRGNRKHLTRCFMKRYACQQGHDGGLLGYYSGLNMGRTHRGRPMCYLNGTTASYWVVFYPAAAEELAVLAGCSLADLPEVLRHWNLFEPYAGNSILDRVDPMLWRVENPWLKLSLAVRFGFSKRAMKKVDQMQRRRPPLATFIDSAQTRQHEHATVAGADQHD